MRRTQWNTLPDEVECMRERFAQWRQSRPGRSRIPEPLWAEAALLARRHGVHPIARALGLNDRALKRQILPAPARCVVEWIHPGGSKMTITLAGPSHEATIASGVDLAGLVQAFWSRPQ